MKYYNVLCPGMAVMRIKAINEKDAIKQAKDRYRADGIDLRGRGRLFKAEVGEEE